MDHTAAHPISASTRLHVVARLLALVALAVQLAAASVVPLRAATAATLLDAPICHAAGPAPADGGVPAPHRSADCVLCPLCQAVAQAGIVLAPTGVAVPPPPAITTAAAWPPQARAPPTRRSDAAPYPRGPPHFV